MPSGCLINSISWSALQSTRCVICCVKSIVPKGIHEHLLTSSFQDKKTMVTLMAKPRMQRPSVFKVNQLFPSILQLYTVPSEFVDQLLYVPLTDGPIFLNCSDHDQSDKALSQIKAKRVIYLIVCLQIFSDWYMKDTMSHKRC